MSLGLVCWGTGGKVKSGSMAFRVFSQGDSIAAVVVTHEAGPRLGELRRCKRRRDGSFLIKYFYVGTRELGARHLKAKRST
jgi:hypothetical protein